MTQALRTIWVDPRRRSQILREAARRSRVRDLVVLRARQARAENDTTPLQATPTPDLHLNYSSDSSPVRELAPATPQRRSEILREAARRSRVRNTVVLRARHAHAAQEAQKEQATEGA